MIIKKKKKTKKNRSWEASIGLKTDFFLYFSSFTWSPDQNVNKSLISLIPKWKWQICVTNVYGLLFKRRQGRFFFCVLFRLSSSSSVMVFHIARINEMNEWESNFSVVLNVVIASILTVSAFFFVAYSVHFLLIGIVFRASASYRNVSDKFIAKIFSVHLLRVECSREKTVD